MTGSFRQSQGRFMQTATRIAQLENDLRQQGCYVALRHVQQAAQALPADIERVRAREGRQ